MTVDTHGTTSPPHGQHHGRRHDRAAPPPIPNDVPHGATYNKTFGRICLLLAVALLAWGALTEVTVTSDDDARADEAASAMIADFNADVYVEIPKIAGIDLSITKPVLYMWMAALLCVGFATWQARRMRPKPNRKQTFVETMYEFLHDQVAKSTLPTKIFHALHAVPREHLPVHLGDEPDLVPAAAVRRPLAGSETGRPGHQGPRPVRGDVEHQRHARADVRDARHRALPRREGARRVGYLETWKPEGHWFLQGFMWFIHAIGELVKFISLSVRLFANMLTGHMLVLVMFTIIFVIGTPSSASTVPVAIDLLPVRGRLVATLQAYIFAVLVRHLHGHGARARPLTPHETRYQYEGTTS